jgi:hypothetical protein
MFFSFAFALFYMQVYSDLEVAFTISEDATVYKALSQPIELLEGHTSVISQHYYGCLFHDLLAFQIGDRHPPQEVNIADLFQFSTSLVLTIGCRMTCFSGLSP